MAIAVTALVVFGLDALTKWLVVAHMAPGESIPVLPGFFYITYVRNAGAAFGLLQHRTALFVAVAVLVIGLILWYGRRLARGSTLLGMALGMVLGGAAGNLVDRLTYGQVIDFLDVRVWAFVFNVADSAIVIGVALFALHLLRSPSGR